MLNEKVWIVIPAYNEEKQIGDVLDELLKITNNIVVVNDASNDKTKEIVQNYLVILLDHIINRGQGAALQTGTEYALSLGAKIIVHFDADDQMQVSDIEKVIKPIEEDLAEVVLGSRFLDKKSKVPWTKKYLILKPASIFHWFYTGLYLSDAHCGFRAMSRKAAQKIEIRQDGMAHATEILDQIRQNELKYKEIPVKIIYHHYGQKFSSGFKILRDLFFAKLFKK